MEIEIRAKLEGPQKTIDLLAKDEETSFVGEKNEKDTYFKHASDTERRLVLRIRRTTSGSTLTFKAKSTGDDTAWPDVDLPLGDADALEGILRSSNYMEVVTITKHRRTYKRGSFEINVDDIEELGWFIEVEGRGNEQERKDIEVEIYAILKTFGASEKDVIRQGYVPLALAKREGKSK